MQDNGRKILRVAVNVLLLLLICLVFTLSYLASKNSQKSSFNDSDLIYVRTEVPAVSNAYWTLLKATNEIYWPEQQEKQLDDLSDNTNWDDSMAKNVLAKNHKCFDLFDQAMQQPSLLVPEPKTFEDDISYLSGWKALALAESIQINSLHRAEKDKEAFASVLKIINFGQRAENSGGTIMHYFVGSAIKSIALARIRQMTADTILGEADLTQLIRELDNFGPNEEGLTNALKVEYKVQCGLLDDFDKGKIPDTTNSEFEQFGTSIAMKPLFSARKTKIEFAQSAHSLLANFSKPYSKITWPNLPAIGTNASTFQRVASGNVIGDILLEMTGPEDKLIPARICHENVNLKATQIILALKVYKIQHGKLPASLTELVPEFFHQVPLDDFDGKPFRYLPDKKIIYSVGPCLKDLGGKERIKGSEDYNYPFKIEF